MAFPVSSLLAGVLLLVAPVVPRDSGDEVSEAVAEKAFKEVFAGGSEPDEGLDILKNIVREYGGTRWADDALWVLAETSARRGHEKSALLYRRMLTKRPVPPCLERFTRGLRIYAASRIPSLLFMLDATGQRYRRPEALPARGSSPGESPPDHAGGRQWYYRRVEEVNPGLNPIYVRVYRPAGPRPGGGRGQLLEFNPLPMVIHEDLAISYGRLGLHRLALQEYQRALAAAPDHALFQDRYRQSIEKTAKRVEEPGGPQSPDVSAGRDGAGRAGYPPGPRERNVRQPAGGQKGPEERSPG